MHIFRRSYSFGTETINTLIPSRISLENHTRFQTKMGKVYTRFQTETAQNPSQRDGTYLYGLYKGVPPPPGGRLLLLSSTLTKNRLLASQVSLENVTQSFEEF